MIRVMSFNIRCASAKDGVNRWENRKALAAGRIAAFGPDLLGLQECQEGGQARFIRQSLPDHEFLGVRRAGGGRDAIEMAPILFCRAVFEARRIGCFWLSETPQIPGSKSWDSAFARPTVWAELIHRPSGRSLFYLNTHVDYRPTARNESARVLRRWIDETAGDRPLIVTGDFNADKNSPAYRLLTGREALCDAFRQAHPQARDEATYHEFGRPGCNEPIDWILISKHFRVRDAGIDRHREGAIYPSDHDPLWATLDWRDFKAGRSP